MIWYRTVEIERNAAMNGPGITILQPSTTGTLEGTQKLNHDIRKHRYDGIRKNCFRPILYPYERKSIPSSVDDTVERSVVTCAPGG